MTDDAKTREERAARNRALMPLSAAIADEWRRVFGPECVFRYVCEGEYEGGRRPETNPARTMNATQWLHYIKTGEVPEGKERPTCRSHLI